jgi:hypothetical protein
MGGEFGFSPRSGFGASAQWRRQANLELPRLCAVENERSHVQRAQRRRSRYGRRDNICECHAHHKFKVRWENQWTLINLVCFGQLNIFGEYFNEYGYALLYRFAGNLQAAFEAVDVVVSDCREELSRKLRAKNSPQ